MKTFRLIVAIRLALFPLIFNLSIAQEVEVNTENFEIFWTETVVLESNTSVDSSLRSEWQEDVDQPLSPQQAEQASDSSPSKEQNSESEVFSPDRGSGEAEGVDDDIPMNFPLSSEWQQTFFFLFERRLAPLSGVKTT